MRILGARGWTLGVFAAALAACGGDPSPSGPADVAGESPNEDVTRDDTRDDTRNDTRDDTRDDAVQDAASDAQPPATSLLSLNLHCLKTEGTTFTTNTARYAAIADRVAAEGVVALAVQEACVRPGESAMDMLSAELRRATGVSWSTHWAFAHKAWEGTADEADEGVGLLVRGALSAPNVITHRVQSALVRVAVSAWVSGLGTSGLRLYSVHFDYVSAAARAAQAREVAVAAAVDTDPGFGALVAGDFNARPGDEAHAALSSFGYRDLTASLDAGRIDHVFAHRLGGVSASSARLVFDGKDGPLVSDHPGVLLTLSTVPREPATITRLTGRAKLVPGDWLALRGGATPLSWSAGWPARDVGDGFRIVLTELAGPSVEVKFLRDDVAWMKGANVSIAPGAEQVIEAAF